MRSTYVTIYYKDGQSEELHENVERVFELGMSLVIEFWDSNYSTYERHIPMERIHEYEVKKYR